MILRLHCGALTIRLLAHALGIGSQENKTHVVRPGTFSVIKCSWLNDCPKPKTNHIHYANTRVGLRIAEWLA